MANLKVSAICVALFAGYILPPVIGWLVFETGRALYPDHIQTVGLVVGLFMLWAVVLGPIVSGYLAAKIATVQPLLHGLVVSALAAVLYIVLLFSQLKYWALLAIPLLVLAGLFGAWLWRRREGIRVAL
jgi:hypothetical protein